MILRENKLMLFCEKTGPEKKEGSNLDVELAKRTHSMPTLHLPINIEESTILGFDMFTLSNLLSTELENL